MSPRVAYFPDSFHEVNGVAHTSRNFQSYAERHGFPFLCVRAAGKPGEGLGSYEQRGELQILELPRSKFSVPLERDLTFDPRFMRHRGLIQETLVAFKPDVIHMTGPSEMGILAAIMAWKMKIPLAASWHTNVHEYAARRAAWATGYLAKETRALAESKVEAAALNATGRFYRLAKVLYAPNAELCALLTSVTGKPCYLMQRGVETDLFTPVRRTRQLDEKEFVLGFVGRLSIEKNVALLPRLQAQLEAAGIKNFRFAIVGHGSEQESLRQELPRAEFLGVLRGEALAQAYANMDVLVFPSHTDTFGNVVLEALASGVPAVVTQDGGPKFIVRDGETGFVAEDDGFAEVTTRLLLEPELLARMRIAARAYAMTYSWDAVFEGVYRGYEEIARVRAEFQSEALRVPEGE